MSCGKGKLLCSMGDMYCTKDEMNSNEGRIYLITKCKMFCAKDKIIMQPVILYSQWLWCCLAFGTVKKSLKIALDSLIQEYQVEVNMDIITGTLCL